MDSDRDVGGRMAAAVRLSWAVVAALSFVGLLFAAFGAGAAGFATYSVDGFSGSTPTAACGLFADDQNRRAYPPAGGFTPVVTGDQTSGLYCSIQGQGQYGPGTFYHDSISRGCVDGSANCVDDTPKTDADCGSAGRSST
ncbi:MAG: hypothetical protein M3N82_00425, partial [Pseudomonadota bacterium]|nr:hypothetical protein [Pseudomonadota bacterium]